MIPSPQDLAKKRANIAQLRKKITKDGYLTEAELVRIVRKAVDSAWMTANNKLVFLEERVIPDMDPATRTKWLIQCEHCKGYFKKADVEVDHKIGEFQCKSPADFDSYITNRLVVGFDDLQILCKPDHAIKTYAERHGISFEEARIRKEAIEVCKQKKDREFLVERGVLPASNEEKRRAQIEQLLKEEK